MQIVKEKITLKYDEEGRLIEQVTTTEYQQVEKDPAYQVYYLDNMQVN